MLWPELRQRALEQLVSLRAAFTTRVDLARAALASLLEGPLRATSAGTREHPRYRLTAELVVPLGLAAEAVNPFASPAGFEPALTT